MENEGKKTKQKVKMNLIQQNVFVLAVTPEFDLKDDMLQSDYVSQDEVVKSDGIKIERTQHDYPITPESVNSYVDGTNYKNDLSASLSRSAPGVNLGDVAAIQELLQKDPEQVASFFASALEKINASKQSVAQIKTDENKEVKDNG